VLQSLIEDSTEAHQREKRHPIGVQTKSRTED
jgi:hypothetical protein